jgi:hypothetical protein
MYGEDASVSGVNVRATVLADFKVPNSESELVLTPRGKLWPTSRVQEAKGGRKNGDSLLQSEWERKS